MMWMHAVAWFVAVLIVGGCGVVLLLDLLFGSDDD